MLTFDFTVHRPTVVIQGTGSLEKGITALTGSSGSGKTTIIKSIAGLIKPETGYIQYNDEIWFDGEKKIFVKPQARWVGYMPQGNIVFPHLSVKNNITYSKRGTAEQLAMILKQLRLEAYAHTKAGQLSGGEQQRVALGRAFYACPSVLLLDEPLSALDWSLRAQVRTDLVDIIRRWDIPCLWVTHDREEAEVVGDRHWTCEKGQLTV